MITLKKGDWIIYRKGQRTNHPMFTAGKAYQVIEYDHNDGPEWPSGCSGRPMVTARGDDGIKVISLASRFDKVTDICPKDGALLDYEEYPDAWCPTCKEYYKVLE